MPGFAGRRRYAMEEEEAKAPSRILGTLAKVVLGLVIAVDASLLAAPLYYGTPNPCSMVALSQAHMHSGAVDDEIGLNDEIATDVYLVSTVWVRSRRNIASCAGQVGGRTLSALLP